MIYRLPNSIGSLFFNCPIRRTVTVKILDIMIIMEHVHYVSQHAHRFFHLGVPFYLHFWGYIQIFGGAIVLHRHFSPLSDEVQEELVSLHCTVELQDIPTSVSVIQIIQM
jgi:hypothetical protein